MPPYLLPLDYKYTYAVLAIRLKDPTIKPARKDLGAVKIRL